MGEVTQAGTIGAVPHGLPGDWARVLGRLRKEVGETAYRSWFRAMTVERVAGGEGVIAVPTRFLRNWVATHYGDRLLALWRSENQSVSRISFVVDPHHGRALPISHVAQAGAAQEGPAPAAPPRPMIVEPSPLPDNVPDAADDKGQLSAPLDPRLTFDNFVVGKPNELAHAAARRVAEACVATAHSVPFNPLFLYGGVGLGKTHLMHAIAWHIAQLCAGAQGDLPVGRKIHVPVHPGAALSSSTMAFKDQFRSVDVLMIDDVQFISGKDSTQEEFFHTFNALVDQNRQIVISADKSPSDLEGHGGARALAARLGPGRRHPPDDLRAAPRHPAIEGRADRPRSCRKRCWSSSPTRSPPTSASSKARSTASSRTATWCGREPTLEAAQELLHDLLRANERRVTIDEIQRQVAEHFNIKWRR